MHIMGQINKCFRTLKLVLGTDSLYAGVRVCVCVWGVGEWEGGRTVYRPAVCSLLVSQWPKSQNKKRENERRSVCKKEEEGVMADTGMWRGGTQKRVRKGGQKEMRWRLRGVDDVDSEGMKSWGLRAHQERKVRGMTCMRLKLCSR